MHNGTEIKLTGVTHGLVVVSWHRGNTASLGMTLPYIRIEVTTEH